MNAQTKHTHGPDQNAALYKLVDAVNALLAAGDGMAQIAPHLRVMLRDASVAGADALAKVTP